MRWHLVQFVQWEPGAVWDSYAFHQYLDDAMSWASDPTIQIIKQTTL